MDGGDAYFWPGTELAIGGLSAKVKSAKFLRTGAPVRFEQTTLQTKFVGLPASAPDAPITTIAECDGEPREDTDNVRRTRERGKA
jgi:alpha-L-fucosidase